jgi:hypothetical protein
MKTRRELVKEYCEEKAAHNVLELIMVLNQIINTFEEMDLGK